MGNRTRFTPYIVLQATFLPLTAAQDSTLVDPPGVTYNVGFDQT